MRLFNFMIDDALDARLKDESERSGIPMSEMARRALRAYLFAHVREEAGERPARGRKRSSCAVRGDE